MNRIEREIERALLAAEQSIGDDGFCDRILIRLPRAKRHIHGSLFRGLTLAGAACIGSLVTLTLGAPADILLADYAGLGGTISALFGSLIAIGILVVPVAWLICAEFANIRFSRFTV